MAETTAPTAEMAALEVAPAGEQVCMSLSMGRTCVAFEALHGSLDYYFDNAKREVTPWDVSGGADGKIDYEKLVKKFGCQTISPELIER
eukprot:4148923-Pyramimonas_sp.AAC.1